MPANPAVTLASDALAPQPASAVIAYAEFGAHCPACAVRGLCFPLGLDAAAIRRLDTLVAGRRRIRKKASLYRVGEPFAALFGIRLGTFKTHLLTEDGREQVTGFYMGGEILGADGIGQERHACEATALEDSEVCVLPFYQLDELAHEIPALRRNLYRCLATDASRGQNMMLLLGSMSAEERLAQFLLDIARRYHIRGYSFSEFVLRMTREEIASYLGLKIETVSRVFSRLHGEGLLQVQGRAIKLLDLGALKRLAKATLKSEPPLT
jgi:CRP/FNR family transcriptional regulator